MSLGASKLTHRQSFTKLTGFQKAAELGVDLRTRVEVNEYIDGSEGKRPAVRLSDGTLIEGDVSDSVNKTLLNSS